MPNFDEYLRKYVNHGQADETENDENDHSGNIFTLNGKCAYYEMSDLSRFAKVDYNYRHTAIHLNIHSLPAKHDQLQSMISELYDMGIIVDFIMVGGGGGVIEFLVSTSRYLLNVNLMKHCCKCSRVVTGGRHVSKRSKYKLP